MSGTPGTVTLTVTLPGATTEGNALVVMIYADCSSSTQSVSGVTLGGLAGYFAQAGTASYAAGGVFEFAWVDPWIAGGQTSLVITMDEPCQDMLAAYCYEVPGLADVVVTDQVKAGNNLAGTFIASGMTSKTTQASELWVGIAGGYGTGITSFTGPATGWANEAGITGSTATPDYVVSGYQVASAEGFAEYYGSVTGSGSISGGCALVVTLLPASTNTMAILPAGSTNTEAAQGETSLELSLAAPTIAGALLVAVITLTTNTIGAWDQIALTGVSDPAENDWSFSTVNDSTNPPSQGGYYAGGTESGYNAIIWAQDAASITSLTIEWGPATAYINAIALLQVVSIPANLQPLQALAAAVTSNQWTSGDGVQNLSSWSQPVTVPPALDQVVLVAGMETDGTGWTPGAGWTAYYEYYTGTAYQLLSGNLAPASYDPAWTFSGEGGHVYASCIVALGVPGPAAALTAATTLTAAGASTVEAGAGIAAGSSLTAGGLNTAVAGAVLSASTELAVVASSTVAGTAALEAASELVADTSTAPASLQVQLASLWTAYMQAAVTYESVMRTWRMMRSVSRTDGTAGSLYARLYTAERAKDQAWDAWDACRRQIYPAPPTN